MTESIIQTHPEIRQLGAMAIALSSLFLIPSLTSLSQIHTAPLGSATGHQREEIVVRMKLKEADQCVMVWPTHKLVKRG